jgi:hypothetical protein
MPLIACSCPYSLRIRQQPGDVPVAPEAKSGRFRQPGNPSVTISCGVAADNSLVRKFVDPPPVVQLTVERDITPQRKTHLLLFCTIWTCEQSEVEQKEHTSSRSLAGNLVASLHWLKDHTGQCKLTSRTAAHVC